jgi:hypothetical protein
MMSMDEKALVAAYEAHDRILALPATDDDKRLIDAIISAYLSAAQPVPLKPTGETATILEGIAFAMESRGYAHMTNGRDIGALLDRLAELEALPTPQPVESSHEPVAEEIEQQAWDCSRWPDWLAAVVDRTNEVADRLDMSSEQAHAYAALSALATPPSPAQNESDQAGSYQTVEEYNAVAASRAPAQGTVERAEAAKPIAFMDETGKVFVKAGSPIADMMKAIPEPPVGRKLMALYASPPVDSDAVKALREENVRLSATIDEMWAEFDRLRDATNRRKCGQAFMVGGRNIAPWGIVDHAIAALDLSMHRSDIIEDLKGKLK